MKQPEQTRVSEHADPHERYNPVPRVVLGLAAALVAWAVVYILVARPDGAAGLGDRRGPELLRPPATQAQAADGRQLFAARCQACHQATGQGLPGVFPPLAGSSWVTGAPEIPIQILLHGLGGPITVAGHEYKGAMPAFGSQLNDSELAAIVSFVRSEWGNSAPAVNADAVRRAREASLARVSPWQAAELEKLSSSAAAVR